MVFKIPLNQKHLTRKCNFTFANVSYFSSSFRSLDLMLSTSLLFAVISFCILSATLTAITRKYFLYVYGIK